MYPTEYIFLINKGYSSVKLEVVIVQKEVVTKLSMASRKLKVQISNELLFELEKMQINFKLN